MKDTLNKIEKILKEHNYRLTKGRKEVLSVFLKEKKHLSVEEVYKIVKSKDISLSTVYRTIDILNNIGIIKSIVFNNQKCYELKLFSKKYMHIHLRCNKCGKILDINNIDINLKIIDIINKLEKQNEFYTKDISITYNGYCSDCKGGELLPRPVKPRKISFMPENKYFLPLGKRKCEIDEIKLKLEELEAMRLKDIEKLNQEECAEKMNVSRQTFQNIIDAARNKVAQALTEGKAINIEGGNYTFNICKYKCKSCNTIFNNTYEKEITECPKCKSEDIVCIDKEGFCIKGCRRRRGCNI